MIYSILSGKEISQCENEFSETGWGTFKKLITEQLIESLEPIQKKYKLLINDPYQLNKILNEGKEISQCENEFSETGWGTYKKLITEQLIESLEPIQKKYKLLINDPYQLNKILDEGKEKAEDLANQTLKRVKSKLGFFEMEK